MAAVKEDAESADSAYIYMWQNHLHDEANTLRNLFMIWKLPFYATATISQHMATIIERYKWGALYAPSITLHPLH